MFRPTNGCCLATILRRLAGKALMAFWYHFAANHLAVDCNVDCRQAKAVIFCEAQDARYNAKAAKFRDAVKLKKQPGFRCLG
ncbi:hypothetical protein [Neobacillus niacini]|uniref:hypothetical protein n=1 Tax=Neobacillus niacini TaxID=86668 RepID=UPI0021CB3A83|nr:hypothetical protein [Neobacillus niacini]MCM3765051.1 hypothetical protein [Neobacillus niacini]